MQEDMEKSVVIVDGYELSAGFVSNMKSPSKIAETIM